MNAPVCQLDEFFLTRLNIEWKEPVKKTAVDMASTFDYDVACHAKEGHLYRLEFRFASKSKTPKPVGLTLDTEIVGFFSFPKEMPKEQMEKLIRLNGCTILYGLLRGELAAVTGSFPAGKFLLPTVMIQDIVVEIEKRKAATGKKTTAKKANPV